MEVPISVSVIVPFHRNVTQLRRCLSALRVASHSLQSRTVLSEIIVVADGCRDDPRAVVRGLGAVLVTIDGPQGPAVARNRGAAEAKGNVLVFVDSDVVVSADALARLVAVLERSTVAAVFGSYDEHPDDPGFISQCRNLAHSFIHHRAPGEAHTFWCGLGAVRSDTFRQVGGLDERFRRPCVEDIDLGYRIRAAGGRVLLDPRIQGQHLKRWTLRSALVSDIRDRGVPWTQLLHRYDGLHDDLNLSINYRLSVVASYVLVASVALAWSWPVLVIMSAASLIALWTLDRSYYAYFTARRGVAFTVAWFPLHIVHHLSNGLSFGLGNVLYAVRRGFGIALPGALPLTTWRSSKHPEAPTATAGGSRRTVV